jgi:hypothetical protein
MIQVVAQGICRWHAMVPNPLLICLGFALAYKAAMVPINRINSNRSFISLRA